MMVALLLSTFLILGVTEIYLKNKGNYLYQKSQTDNQNNIRFATNLLDEQLSKAGYISNPEKNTKSFVFASIPAVNGCTYEKEQFIAITNNKKGVCFLYQVSSSDDEVDCLGNLASKGAILNILIQYELDPKTNEGLITCTAQGKKETLVSGLLDFSWFPLQEKDSSLQAVKYAALFESKNSSNNGVSSNILSRWKELTGHEISNNTSAMQIMQGSVTLRNLTQ